DVVLPHPTVARAHARIVREGEVYYLEDLDSRTGTWLNDVRLRGRAPLRHNDRIRLAGCELVFDASAPAAADLRGPAVEADTAVEGADTATERESRRGWQAAAAELRAARQRQRATWGELDDALLGRCLAGEASPAEQRQFETALGQHPALAELADLV